MKISFNMATMPERVEGANATINSVYEQCDVIRLYLNNFTTIPEYFKRDKIIIQQVHRYPFYFKTISKSGTNYKTIKYSNG